LFPLTKLYYFSNYYRNVHYYLNTHTGEISYLHLRLGEIDYSSADFIHDNLKIAIFPFTFWRLPVLCDLFAEGIDFYDERLAKFK